MALTPEQQAQVDQLKRYLGGALSLFTDGADPYAPATITWPTGETIALTRAGDIVTAEVDPHGVEFITSSNLPYPATYFMPSGTGQMGIDVNESRNYTVYLRDEFGVQPDGIRLQQNGAGPFTTGTVRWLAEPAPVTPGLPIDEQLWNLIVLNGGSLYITASNIWGQYAASTATLIDVTEGSSRRQLGDLYDQAMKMSLYYRGLADGENPTTSDVTRTRGIVRP